LRQGIRIQWRWWDGYSSSGKDQLGFYLLVQDNSNEHEGALANERYQEMLKSHGLTMKDLEDQALLPRAKYLPPSYSLFWLVMVAERAS